MNWVNSPAPNTWQPCTFSCKVSPALSVLFNFAIQSKLLWMDKDIMRSQIWAVLFTERHFWCLGGNKGFHDLCSSLNAIRTITSRQVTWAGHVERRGGKCMWSFVFGSRWGYLAGTSVCSVLASYWLRHRFYKSEPFYHLRLSLLLSSTVHSSWNRIFRLSASRKARSPWNYLTHILMRLFDVIWYDNIFVNYI